MTGSPAADIFTAAVYGLVPLAGVAVGVFWAVRAVRSRRAR